MAIAAYYYFFVCYFLTYFGRLFAAHTIWNKNSLDEHIVDNPQQQEDDRQWITDDGMNNTICNLFLHKMYIYTLQGRIQDFKLAGGAHLK